MSAIEQISPACPSSAHFRAAVYKVKASAETLDLNSEERDRLLGELGKLEGASTRGRCLAAIRRLLKPEDAQLFARLWKVRTGLAHFGATTDRLGADAIEAHSLASRLLLATVAKRVGGSP